MVAKTDLPSGTRDRAASRELGLRIAAIADDKGGTDIELIEVGKLVSYTDFLVLCTARNERMARAIADETRLRLKRESGLLPRGSEGDTAAGWLVMDYLDSVLHIFTAEARERYQLGELWRDAPRVDLAAVIATSDRAESA